MAYIDRLPAPGRLYLMFGRSLRLFFGAFAPSTLRRLSGSEVRQYFTYMGVDSVNLVTTSAVFVSVALTTQIVVELQRYGAQSASGALIAVGLLRELGSMTVGMIWAARMAAFLSEDTITLLRERELTAEFFATRYIAALASSLPLSVYGMVFGFAAATLYAPLIGVGSTSDFLEAGRQAINTKDLSVYFIKLVLVNPTVVLLTSMGVAFEYRDCPERAGAEAVTGACLGVFIVNLFVTLAFYLP
ncbi:MAG: ABC transporter permease [Candidatus Obscuribacterales bacterium]|nr:ABC transporter permease [Candidatus Obscuribacterales bacterium]